MKVELFMINHRQVTTDIFEVFNRHDLSPDEAIKCGVFAIVAIIEKESGRNQADSARLLVKHILTYANLVDKASISGN